MTTRPVRVLHVINSLEPGGAERLLLDVVRSIDRTRFEPSIVYLLGGGSLVHGTTLTCEVRRAGPGRLRPSSVWSLWQIMRSGGYEILHTHDALSGLLARQVARWAGMRHIVTTRHMPHLMGRHPWLYRLENRALRSSNAIVAISGAVAQALLEIDPYLQRFVTVIPNAVDTAQFHPLRAEGPASRPFVAGTVCRLVPEKDIATLLRAVARLRDRGRAPARVVIVGDGPDREELSSLASELDIAPLITFAGNLQAPAEVCDALQSMDVFVLPSRAEGFGIAALEAMAVGVPVVCSRVGGLPELVRDGTDGRLFPAGDVGALADALESLMNNGAMRRAMGAQARTRAVEQFSLSAYAKRLEQVYDGLLSRHA